MIQNILKNLNKLRPLNKNSNLNLFTKQQYKIYKFSSVLHSLPEKIKDVYLLNQHENLNYIALPQKTITFNPSMTLQQFQQNMAEKHRIFPIKMYDLESNSLYSASTPLYFILQNDFAFQIFDEYYYICVGKTQLQSSQDFENSNKYSYLYRICGLTNNSSVSNNTLQKFLTEFLQKLQDTPGQKLSSTQIQTLFSTQLYQMAVQNEKKTHLYEELLEMLVQKQKKLKKEKEDLKKLAEKKSKRGLRALFTFYGLQAYMLQYGTYVLFSWDIIEPIACLCGTFDMVLAYYYWMRHTRDFDFENVWQRKFEKVQGKVFRKKQFPEESLEEVEMLIDHLQMRKGYLSCQEQDLKKAVEGDLKII